MPRLTNDGLGSVNSPMRQYVLACLTKLGHDLYKCAYCAKPLKKPQIHHTKYDGATVYDLVIACQSCNTQPQNRFLV